MTIPFLSLFKRLVKRFSFRSAIFFWFRHYKKFFFLGFLVILSVGGWNWYQSLYRYRFSDDEKKRYIDSYFKETIFKETRFRETVENLVVRADLHEEVLQLKRNIFEGKGIKPKE
ncbi:MAG: hypothetical protein Q8Q10_01630 [bacterium]|nr:hypothetical protein [bacterium]